MGNFKTIAAVFVLGAGFATTAASSIPLSPQAPAAVYPCEFHNSAANDPALVHPLTSVFGANATANPVGARLSPARPVSGNQR
jgi:hypothetical protein